MKKFALAFALTFTALTAVVAQTDDTGFRFGFHATPTLSWMKTNDKLIEGAGTNLGIRIGAMADFFFAPNYAFTTGLGLGFNQGGTLQNGHSVGVFWPESDLSSPRFDTLPSGAKLHYRLNFVEIPFGLKLRGGSGEDNPIKFFAEIPVFTLGFTTKAIGDIRGTNALNTEDEDIRDDVNSITLSWGLGGGIEYEITTNTRIVAGLSYQQQFTDITGDKGAIFKNNAWGKETSKATVSLLALRLGVFF